MTRQFTFFFLSSILIASAVHAQTGYSNYRQQAERIVSLKQKDPGLVKVSVLTRTNTGKDIPMIYIGKTPAAERPAIAVVAGVDGSHLLGTELAIGIAEYLVSNRGTDSIRKLLNECSFYIFPNMSPEASDQYFTAIRYERKGNGTSTDDDRDGKFDEDGFEDLNGDGKITWMRIASPVGPYKASGGDPRVLEKADLLKGDTGSYLLLSEGVDNDKDGQFNEDGPGGVWFNKNFPFRHLSFTTGAGEFPVSEKENRALLDTLYNLFNVFAVLTFGPDDNLFTPPAYNAKEATQRIIAGYLEPDVISHGIVSAMYNRQMNTKDPPKASSRGGDFLSWCYYNYGRFAFGTPGWYVPRYKADTAKKETASSGEDSVINYLKWAGQQGITNSFTDWKSISHPDFPGRKVEVGGLDPFVLLNPPYRMVREIVEKHASFLVKLAGMRPQIALTDLKTEKLGQDVTRVTVTLLNQGVLPSYPKIGERNYWVRRLNVRLHTGKAQTLISGRNTQLLDALEGKGSQTLAWLIKGKGTLIIEAGCPSTGTRSLEVPL